MGQRSQIYVTFNSAARDKNGVIIPEKEPVIPDGFYAADCNTQQLVALYFQWNYGSRMVSRAVGLIEWLRRNMRYIAYGRDKIKHIAETNFDFHDVVMSTDIIQETLDFYEEWIIPVGEHLNDSIFKEQDNNDGKLFISVGDDGTIKYCFTDWECAAPMNAPQYMDWGDYPTEEEDDSNYLHNVQWLKDNAELMTTDDLKKILETEYDLSKYTSIKPFVNIH